MTLPITDPIFNSASLFNNLKNAVIRSKQIDTATDEAIIKCALRALLLPKVMALDRPELLTRIEQTWITNDPRSLERFRSLYKRGYRKDDEQESVSQEFRSMALSIGLKV